MEKAIKILEDELEYYQSIDLQWETGAYISRIEGKIVLLEDLIEKLKAAK